MLFDSIIIGPIHSRRLGTSLGVNLLHEQAKICSFDCVYCECGFNFTNKDSYQPSREDVRKALDAKLQELSVEGKRIDVITFAGNGEPTTHKQFPEIIDDTIKLRDNYFPDAKISVLSNATMIWKPEVRDALNRVDNNILKFDSAIDATVQAINRPIGRYSVENIIRELADFKGNVIIQTLFLRGEYNGFEFDNTSEEEVSAWLEALKKIKPKEVMLYSLDRPTPAKQLTKIQGDELEKIAQRVRELGIATQVTK
jgi:wyosine [tRNA(Phe)-imidazoG37] synthetase (radical SAM superfamily)